MFKFLKEIFYPIVLSIRNLFTKPFTIQYPKEELILPDSFNQGRHIVDFSLCVGCQQCARICPTKCIKMVKVLPEEGGNPNVNKPLLYPAVSLETCMFCNLCEEICPTNPKAIRFSKFFEMSNTDKRALIFHPKLLEDLKGTKYDRVKNA